jgi:propanediol dehydratase small subunit
MQWLQDANESNVDNLNSVMYEASRPFRKKKRECLIAKMNELEMKYKNKNVRDLYMGISDFKKGY